MGRAPWPCGLICHVLDREVEGSNLATARSHRFNFFNAGSHQFLLVKRRWKAKEGERRWKVETLFEALINTRQYKLLIIVLLGD